MTMLSFEELKNRTVAHCSMTKVLVKNSLKSLIGSPRTFLFCGSDSKMSLDFNDFQRDSEDSSKLRGQTKQRTCLKRHAMGKHVLKLVD